MVHVVFTYIGEEAGMKTATTAMVLLAFLVAVGYGQQEASPKVEGRPATPPAVSLHVAALQGNIDAVRQHIAAGTDLNEKDAFGSTPLIIAATFGRAEVAKALIEAGAALEITSSEGSTPLHVAAFFCRTEIVKALLESGANKYVRNDYGSTPLESVSAPFEDVEDIYDTIGQTLGPLGLKLDYEWIKVSRPQIVEMFRPTPEELETVEYTPLPGGDWKVSTPSAQGLDSMLVAELYLDAAHLETLYGLLVVKNGHLIAEGYFNEGSVDQLSKRASVTKSYTSAMIGIALDQGHLSSVEQKMVDFFPELAGQIVDPRKKQITIRDMLQMRAGYPWEETDPALWEALWSGSYLHLIADVQLMNDPGTEFQYSNLTSHWLGIVVARACGTDLKSYAEKHLFSLLDVEVGDWNQDVDGYYIGCGDIQFTARDMAKFGLLYLNEGEYGGKQILSSDWVRASLRRYSENVDSGSPKSGRSGNYLRNIGYGYQWWSAEAGGHHLNYAAGHGGQLIVLLDDLNMVIVTTADPFWGEDLHFQAWTHEKAIINLVGKFVSSLPNE
jgi:CubicO group peptidase (beta-lactamase class C family)